MPDQFPSNSLQAVPGARDRLLRILYRHTPDDGIERSDEGFIRATIHAWERHLKAEIVDVGE